MSNIHQIIPERSRDIGDFLVGRLLPFRKKRMVGPFIFIDHMGPSTVGPGHYMDIGQHPHIGLSTLTWLLEGAIHHKDSLGSDQIIRPGSVNWMTAGSGVVHTERTPVHWRDGGSYLVHGYQVWVALPKEKEHMPAEFHHVAAKDLPYWEESGVQMRLVAGSFGGHKSPVPVYSPLYMMEWNTENPASISPDERFLGEWGISVVEGGFSTCGERIGPGNMLAAKPGAPCQFELEAGSRLLIFGGEAFPEERFIYWNFVASSQERLAQAKQDWQTGKFKLIPGEGDPIRLI